MEPTVITSNEALLQFLQNLSNESRKKANSKRAADMARLTAQKDAAYGESVRDRDEDHDAAESRRIQAIAEAKRVHAEALSIRRQKFETAIQPALLIQVEAQDALRKASAKLRQKLEDVRAAQLQSAEDAFEAELNEIVDEEEIEQVRFAMKESIAAIRHVYVDADFLLRMNLDRELEDVDAVYAAVIELPKRELEMTADIDAALNEQLQAVEKAYRLETRAYQSAFIERNLASKAVYAQGVAAIQAEYLLERNLRETCLLRARACLHQRVQQ